MNEGEKKVVKKKKVSIAFKPVDNTANKPEINDDLKNEDSKKCGLENINIFYFYVYFNAKCMEQRIYSKTNR